MKHDLQLRNKINNLYKIYEIIVNDGTISIEDIAEKIGLSTPSVVKYISLLKRFDVIKRDSNGNLRKSNRDLSDVIDEMKLIRLKDGKKYTMNFNKHEFQEVSSITVDIDKFKEEISQSETFFIGRKFYLPKQGYICPICGYIVHSIRSLRYHFDKTHGLARKCFACGKKDIDLKRHLWKHYHLDAEHFLLFSLLTKKYLRSNIKLRDLSNEFLEYVCKSN